VVACIAWLADFHLTVPQFHHGGAFGMRGIMGPQLNPRVEPHMR